MLKEIEAYILAGKIDVAERELQKILSKKNIGIKETIEAKKLKVRVLLAKHQYDNAQEILDALIMDAERLDDIPLTASLFLLKAETSLLMKDNEECLIMIKKAERLLSSEKNKEQQENKEITFLYGRLESVKGQYHWDVGNKEDALSCFKRSIAIFEELKENKALLENLYYIGNLYYHSGKYDLGLEVLAKMRELASQLDAHEFLVKALNHIGLIYERKGEYEKALQCFETCYQIARAHDFKDALAAAINNQGLIYLNRGEWDKALVKFKDAVEIYEAIGEHKRLGVTLNNIGYIYIEKGEWEKALVVLTQSAEILKMANDWSNLSLPYRNMGMLYLDLGEYTKALKFVKKSLELRIKVGNKDRQADSYNLLGIIYRKKGNFTVALRYFQKALDIWKIIQHDISLSAVYYNFGELYREIGELEKALRYIKLSGDYARKAGHEVFYIDALEIMALIYWQQRKFKKAIDFLEEVLRLRKTVNNQVLYAESILNMIRVLLDYENYNKALHYFEILQTLTQQPSIPAVVTTCTKIAEALILRANPRQRSKFKAQKILEEVLIRETTISSELYFFCQLIYCDLLLFELMTFGENEALDELKKNIDLLFKTAVAQNSYWLLAEVYLLKAKVLLLELKTEESFKLLRKALKITRKKGLKALKAIIVDEKETMLKQSQYLRELQGKTEDTLQHRIQILNVGATINYLITRRVKKVKKKRPTKNQILFAILTALSDNKLKICAFYPPKVTADLQKFSAPLIAEAAHLDTTRLPPNKMIVWRVHSNIYCVSYRSIVKIPSENVDTAHVSQHILSDCHIFVKEEIINDIYMNSRKLLEHLSIIRDYIPNPETRCFFDNNSKSKYGTAAKTVEDTFTQFIEDFSKKLT